MVFSERRRCSSLMFCVLPTRDDSDIVTCIFTRAKFWVGREEEHACLWALGASPQAGPSQPADITPLPSCLASI